MDIRDVIRIDLNEGRFSDVCDMTGNLGIAYGTVIENVRSGSAEI